MVARYAVDHVGVFANFLAESPDIPTAAGKPRIYEDELPFSISRRSIPRCVLVSNSPVTRLFATAPTTPQGIDVRCYASTPRDARILAGIVQQHIKQVFDHSRRVAGVWVVSIVPTGGIVSLRDSLTDWPYTFQSYEINVGDYVEDTPRPVALAARAGNPTANLDLELV